MCSRRSLKLTLAVLAFGLVTLACGESARQSTEPPTTELPSVTPEATVTIEIVSEVTETAVPPAPTVDTSGCTLNATYEADVTIPDNTQIEAGQSFEKVWRIRNTGTCDWSAGYRWTFVEGDQMGGSDSLAIPDTPAGESTEISVELVAPATGGQYRGYWQTCVNGTECFGDRLYVQILSIGPTPTPLPRTSEAFANCLDCARRRPWLLRFQSEPGLGRGTVPGGVRHGDPVTIEDAQWVAEEEQWWYLVEGWDDYTNLVSGSVSGWVQGSNIAIGSPDPYPLGSAWVEFVFDEEEMDVIIWDRPSYYNGRGRGIGALWHGTMVEITDSQWDAESGIWFYEITGVDYQTGNTVTGWLDGIFLVLSPP